MSDLPAALSFRFAEAVMARDLIAADALPRGAAALYGDRGVVALSFAIASSRVYPTVKYALGHGRACERRGEGRDRTARTRRSATHGRGGGRVTTRPDRRPSSTTVTFDEGAALACSDR
ncbi:MAG: hypothetical protein U0235_13395 [Polyangiaceae bacterium]